VAFFSKPELSPIERFESALKDKHLAREKLTDRLRAAEMALEEKRAAATRLAMAGAADAQLDWAEADMRTAEDRTKTLRTASAQLDEQIATTERELADAKTQRDRDIVADELERMATAIEQAAPNYDAAVIALVEIITKGEASIPETTRFATNLDAVRREVLSAADFICSELRSTATRTRAGNANFSVRANPEPERPPPREIEHQLIYTLNPLLWREGDEVRKVPAFAQVELPKMLLPVALRYQHVDYLEARRVRTLMQVHGSGQFYCTLQHDDPRLVDLDALAAQEMRSGGANAA
jgi:DNA-binding transcriptional MerR regulator